MADKKKKPVFISPAGRALFPWLRVPDDKYAKDGIAKYKVTLVLEPDADETQEFIAQINGWLTKVGGDVSPYELDDKDGKIHVKFKSKFPPGIFDTKRNAIPQEVDIGNGSVIKVAFEANHFDTKIAGNGINLYLKAVQVLNLATYDGPSADALGFGDEEGFSPAESVDDIDAAFPKDPPPPTDKEIAEGDDDENLPF